MARRPRSSFRPPPSVLLSSLIDLDHAIIIVHLYEPPQFTMQSVTLDLPTGAAYPGIINGVRWDRAQMAHSLQVVASYQKHYPVAIYIGEFSAAPHR